MATENQMKRALSCAARLCQSIVLDQTEQDAIRDAAHALSSGASENACEQYVRDLEAVTAVHNRGRS